MNVDIGTCLRYYKRREIQEAIVLAAADKEVAIRFGGGGYGKRPDVLQYPGDVLALVKKGATSFHCSEELWGNPLMLSPALKRKDLDDLRKGWDLVLDIDCKYLPLAQITAHLLVEALKFHHIKSYSVKYSGNNGFHIAVPFEAFPSIVHGKEVRLLFPDGPRRIATYLKDMIKVHLGERIIALEDVEKICERVGKPFSEVVKNGVFDPFVLVDIDTILISSRHLYRMPYSINEKSGLVSIPIKDEEILGFKREDAAPENVKVSDVIFLSREGIEENEARQLIIQAFDFSAKETIDKEERESRMQKKYDDIEEIQHAVPEECFPPCIKGILNGVEDGRKRAVFVLVNFLTSVGWDYEKIEERLRKWNEKNAEPLREVYYLGQLRYHKQQKKKVLPPNCSNKQYYVDMRVCKPIGLCSKIKNPTNFAIIRGKQLIEQEKEREKKEAREKKRKEREEKRAVKEKERTKEGEEAKKEKDAIVDKT